MIAVLAIVAAGLAAACASSATPSPTTAPAAPAAPAGPPNAAAAPTLASDSLGLIQAGTLTVATQDVQRPFTQIDEKTGQRTGFAIDFVDEIGRRLNLKTSYTAMSLQALVPAVGTDQYDLGAVGLQVTEERKKTVEFATPYYWGYAGLLVPAANPLTLKQMDGKSVAALRGSVQEQTLKDKYPGIVLKTFDAQSNAMAALRGSQVDGFLVGGADAEDYSRQDPTLTVTDQLPSDNPTAMPIARGKTALVQAVDAQINSMIKDGTYKKLYSKWFSEPVLKPFLDLHPELAN